MKLLYCFTLGFVLMEIVKLSIIGFTPTIYIGLFLMILSIILHVLDKKVKS